MALRILAIVLAALLATPAYSAGGRRHEEPSKAPAPPRQDSSRDQCTIEELAFYLSRAISADMACQVQGEADLICQSRLRGAMVSVKTLRIPLQEIGRVNASSGFITLQCNFMSCIEVYNHMQDVYGNQTDLGSQYTDGYSFVFFSSNHSVIQTINQCAAAALGR